MFRPYRQSANQKITVGRPLAKRGVRANAQFRGRQVLPTMMTGHDYQIAFTSGTLILIGLTD